jgi:hypothetical protein
MKTVGLAVVVYKKNYGSMLQSYATQAVVAKLGFCPEIIRIEPFSRAIRIGKAKFFLNRFKSREERQYLFNMLATEIRKSAPTRFAADVKKRNRKYRDFSRQVFSFSPPYSSVAEVIERCRAYEAVVVGSDQLWRPSNIEGDFFTLGFVPEGIKRIAYATSFGVAQLPSDQYAKVGKFLGRFEYVSVREEAGKYLVKKASGRDVPVVCDPSMLLDASEWLEVEKDSALADRSYILCYFLGDNPEFRMFARRLAAFTGLKVVGLLHGATYIPGDDSFPDEAMYDVGPSEFLGLVRNAAFVCTDSFHGTVFSILFEKRFFCFRRFVDSSELSTNDRLNTLLRWSGLEGRLLSGHEAVRTCVDMSIEYDDVLGRVARKRAEGMGYLRAALGVV